MPLEDTGKTRDRTDCLKFDVFLCIPIKKQISIRGRKHWGIYFFCGILHPAGIQDGTKFPGSITDVFLQ